MDLRNTKVYVNGKGNLLTCKLQDLGYKVSEEILITDTFPFLYINFDNLCYFGYNMKEFMNSEYKEIKSDDIMNIITKKM